MRIILTLIVLAPFVALAHPIARCQQHLLENREHLAQVELETFARLRSPETGVPNYLGGLLLGVYEADLDGEPLTLSEAYSYVPAVTTTSIKYIQMAVTRGALILDDAPADDRSRRVRTGPRLRDLVHGELETELARLFENVRQLKVAPHVAWGLPEGARSEALDRTIIRKLWYAFDRTWQPAAPENRVHLRSTYGLLAQLYKMNLRGEGVGLRFAGRYIPIKYASGRAKLLDAAIEQGLIRVVRQEGHERSQRLHATEKTVQYVETRINGGIDRNNAILKQLAYERE